MCRPKMIFFKILLFYTKNSLTLLRPFPAVGEVHGVSIGSYHGDGMDHTQPLSSH